MNGATVLRDTLLGCNVDVCFANPGTSEMHFVAALDAEPRLRCVLGLAEGVVTGAADGYARMTGRPAATLLHLGPGLANGLANLHNARRARTPMINVIGDHAHYHLANDSPLTSDIESLARPMSHFVRRIAGPDDVGPATVEAYASAMSLPGIASLILPADAAWGETSAAIPEVRLPVRAAPSAQLISEIARRLHRCRRRGGRAVLLLGGDALRGPALTIAATFAASGVAQLFGETLSARAERGAGRTPVERVLYAVPLAVDQLRHVDLLVTVCAPPPVAFFAYPNLPVHLVREDCEVAELCPPGADSTAALQALQAELGVRAATAAIRPVPDGHGPLPQGELTADGVGAIIAQLLPEGSIVCDEALTAMGPLYSHTAASAPHDYLQNTGGAIGIGIPLATGAALACPSRKVIAVQADGSAMYTIQALWTQAREGLDVLTVILANRSYAILHHEMRAVGVASPGHNAKRMLNLDDPVLDFVSLAKGLGVDAARARTGAELARLMTSALARSGPFLIEAVL